MLIQMKNALLFLPTGNFVIIKTQKYAKNYLATIPTNSVLICLLTLSVVDLSVLG